MGPALRILLAYFGLTVIVLGLASADFGRVMVRMPSPKSALALSEISSGRFKLLYVLLIQTPGMQGTVT